MEGDVYEATERVRLQRLMEKDLNAPVGYVLPLHYSHRRHRWISNQWRFKSPHLVLLTGDSPIGQRDLHANQAPLGNGHKRGQCQMSRR